MLLTIEVPLDPLSMANTRPVLVAKLAASLRSVRRSGASNVAAVRAFLASLCTVFGSACRGYRYYGKKEKRFSRKKKHLFYCSAGPDLCNGLGKAGRKRARCCAESFFVGFHPPAEYTDVPGDYGI